VRLAVLNPRGRDPEQDFPDFAGAPGSRLHPPVNYHAYAACTGGGFHRSVSSLPPGRREVLLLIRRREMALCVKTLAELRRQGRFVAVAAKECGLHQVAELLGKPGNPALFGQLCSGADLCLAATPDLVPIYRAAGAKRVEFIPTPYPVDDARWDFSIPAAERRGVFIGTREFGVPSRNHLAALLCARGFQEPVTVVNSERATGRRLLAGLGFKEGGLRVVEGYRPYPDYLRLMAAHRLVFQLDRSAVPGQVAGDALLCGIPCAGGDSAVERLAFPSLSGDFTRCVEAARELLSDPGRYEKAVEESRAAASARLSFRSVRKQLEALSADRPPALESEGHPAA